MNLANTPIWELAKTALINIGGEDTWIPINQIVKRVVDLNPERKINKGTVDHQIRKFCVNCHPTHNKFRDGGKAWKNNPIFVSDKKGNYKIFDPIRDDLIYRDALAEDNILKNSMHNDPDIIRKPQAEESHNELNVKIIDTLERIGIKIGFKVAREWPVPMGRIDIVWYLDLPFTTDEKQGKKLMVGGFEIESSWRTRKHIKGDIMNLISLNAPFSAIIQQKGDEDKPEKIESLIRNTREFMKTINKQLFILSADNIKNIMNELGLNNAAN